MGFFSDLFGGGGSQQGTSTVIQQNSNEPFAQQVPFLEQRFRQAGALAGGLPQIDQSKLLEHLKTTNDPVYGQYITGQVSDLVPAARSVINNLAANDPQTLQSLMSTKQMAEYFPGQTFVDFAPETWEAMSGIAEAATGYDPLLEGARQQAMNTISGGFLSSGNPYFQDVANSVANAVAPQVQSRFARAGRGGSGAESAEFTRIMADTMAPLAFQNYQSERGAQNQAIYSAPQNFFGQDISRLGQLTGVGAMREQKAAEQLADQINRYNFEQSQPERELGLLSQFTGGTYGGQSTGTSAQPIFSGNPLFGALGTGMAVAGMGQDFGWWGS